MAGAAQGPARPACPLWLRRPHLETVCTTRLARSPPRCTPAPVFPATTQVLKTTQSGYAGFLKDRFTTLPDTAERIVATEVTASWK